MMGKSSILTKRSNLFGLRNEVSYIKFLVTKHGEDNKFHPKLILQGASMLSTNRDMILNTYFALIAPLCLSCAYSINLDLKALLIYMQPPNQTLSPPQCPILGCSLNLLPPRAPDCPQAQPSVSAGAILQSGHPAGSKPVPLPDPGPAYKPATNPPPELEPSPSQHPRPPPRPPLSKLPSLLAPRLGYP